MNLFRKAIHAIHWRWVAGGFVVSLLSFTLIPFNLAGLSAYEIWKLWLLFPYGMFFRPWYLPLPFDILAWLGPPVIYGLVLSVAAGKSWWRPARYSLLIIHTIAAFAVAFQ